MVENIAIKVSAVMWIVTQVKFPKFMRHFYSHESLIWVRSSAKYLVICNQKGYIEHKSGQEHTSADSGDWGRLKMI